MILYKTIALKFGYYLDNEQPENMPGPDGQLVLSEEIRQHWQSVLRDLGSARIYLLDHNAVNYLESLRMDVQGMPWEDRPESNIQGFVSEVDFPRDLIWIEYDDRTRGWEEFTSQWDQEIEFCLSVSSQQAVLFLRCPLTQSSTRIWRSPHASLRHRSLEIVV